MQPMLDALRQQYTEIRGHPVRVVVTTVTDSKRAIERAIGWVRDHDREAGRQHYATMV